ncbi:GPI ethanolamine phosphate transferase 2 [Penicillium chermesinum]|uniref:GPI ethanolamine phosphate transferase 2 n=1 Tax=Penicillium chermesinum TaxID=63820 RepID=A0A9W9TXV3_9EURO|nr:GPI ethanolamine phosphate transferase 2 [Penicillium chermesinum]KAJ5246938.1 GPI ethanolamine phosphate transferase 2 [Penicillium chermesinum]
MAKSVRASVSKRNRANLRKNVFGPVADARTERLAAKLQELASQPRPSQEKPTGEQSSEKAGEDANGANPVMNEDEMELDAKASKNRVQKAGRVQKRNRKPRNSMVSGRMAILSGHWAVLLANLLVPVGILVFSTGFFPYKPLLPGLAILEDIDQDVPPVFDKVIFMVVDALRSDFVYSHESGFQFTQSLIRDGTAIPFTARASSPTVTMPRLKAITTGSVPSFLDVILNIAESDTSSTLAYQDTWLAQLKARGDRLVMYGDDTWLKLFPGMFDRADGTTSFFVSDFIEVDQNVTRHVAFELSQPDWSAFIMHYLGLDHIGHKAGPKSPFMPAKHREMDDVVNEVYSALQQEPHLNSTLFILCGDHGMNEAGNHGGSSAGETSPALLFISPKLEQLGTQLQSPIGQNGDFEYYRTVEQVDITPTLAGLLGLPISRNSLGIFIPEFLNMWDSDGQKLKILHRNARQLLTTVEATFPGSFSSENPTGLDCEVPASDIARAQCLWSRVHELFRETNKEMAFRTISPALHEVLGIAQNVMSSTASNYDVSRLGLGLLITTAAALLVLPTVSHQCARSYHAGLFLALMVIGYGAMMFASSYVEEEQQFWYWICSGWIFYLHIKSGAYKSSSHHGTGLFHRTNAATLGLLMAQRILRRWNQTGQKFAAEPDIAHTLFSRKPAVMWALVALTYMDSGYHFLQGLPAAVLPRLGAFVLPALALVFKMNFVANDSPELLADSILSRLMEAWPKDLSLVWQARLVFACLTCCSLVAIFNRGNSKITGGKSEFAFELADVHIDLAC